MYKTNSLEIKISKIHGKGLFARVNFEKDELICLAVKKGKNIETTYITYPGKWINHSELNPNVYLTTTTLGWSLAALRNIEAGEELVANYRDAPVFIKRPEDYGGNFKL